MSSGINVLEIFSLDAGIVLNLCNVSATSCHCTVHTRVHKEKCYYLPVQLA